MIASPDMVHFWNRENLHMPKVRKVIILEDAEPLLLERSGDNWRQLSNLLNVSDGLLADLLKVQIICTMNSGVRAIDPAVMRGGRLLASRHFPRISSACANHIARNKNLHLPEQEDYSVAEIYHAPVSALAFRAGKRLGF